MTCGQSPGLADACLSVPRPRPAPPRPSLWGSDEAQFIPGCQAEAWGWWLTWLPQLLGQEPETCLAHSFPLGGAA